MCFSTESVTSGSCWTLMQRHSERWSIRGQDTLPDSSQRWPGCTQKKRNPSSSAMITKRSTASELRDNRAGHAAVIQESIVTTYPPIPPHDDLLAIIRAAQANAADLLGDAELLADNERYSRAYALATLASEEVSKAEHCLWAICSTQMPSEEFWTNFRSHEGKL